METDLYRISAPMFDLANQSAGILHIQMYPKFQPDQFSGYGVKCRGNRHLINMYIKSSKLSNL